MDNDTRIPCNVDESDLECVTTKVIRPGALVKFGNGTDSPDKFGLVIRSRIEVVGVGQSGKGTAFRYDSAEYAAWYDIREVTDEGEDTDTEHISVNFIHVDTV